METWKGVLSIPCSSLWYLNTESESRHKTSEQWDMRAKKTTQKQPIILQGSDSLSLHDTFQITPGILWSIVGI